jgi:hypothetical protein
MSQIFTVEIEYSIYKHRALVSVSSLQREPIFHVQFIDGFLRDLFGTEHIRYKGTNGYQYHLYNDELADEMIGRIGKAIEQKLYGKTALIRRLFSVQPKPE